MVETITFVQTCYGDVEQQRDCSCTIVVSGTENVKNTLNPTSGDAPPVPHPVDLPLYGSYCDIAYVKDGDDTKSLFYKQQILSS